MKATILNIGDELLIGQVVNTNASRMAQMLTQAGIDVCGTYVIGDNAEDINYYLRHCLERSEAVLMTGGLGPTKDDITKKCLCQFFDSELYENEEALANVRRIFEARGYELTPINRQQAWVPRCCTVINNVLGTAPCMWFSCGMENGEWRMENHPGAAANSQLSTLQSECRSRTCSDYAESGNVTDQREVTPNSQLSTINSQLSIPNSQFKKVVVSLPGVPFEMENLMATEVVPRLVRHFRTDQIVIKNILVQGIGESFLSDLIEPWETALPKNIRLAYLPQAGMVKLRLTAHGGHDDRPKLEQQISDAVAELYPLAGKYIVGEDMESLPELVAYTFKKYHLTLATAESCTGGMLAHQLTAMAGASEYYRGGVVSYCNEVKECALGVRHDTLETYDAVSEETVSEMATGVRTRLGADYAVATTGVAGPSGGTPERPVGTVWIGIAGPEGQLVTKLLHFGDRRAQTIERTTHAVWAELIKLVKSTHKE